MRSISAIPAELHDQIVDNLHMDKYALAACGLASREWLPSSRYHLFQSIALGPSSSKRFLDLLGSPCCTILPFVRKLRLEEGCGKFSCDEKWLSEGIPRLKRLSGVRCLHLRNLSWEDLAPAAQDAFIMTFREITDLEIHCASFEPISLVIGTPYAFPMLQRIVVTAVQHPRTYSAIQRYPITNTTQNLHIGIPNTTVGDQGDIQRPLHDHHDKSVAKRSLQLSNICPLWTPSIGKFLGNLGTSLRHLRIGFAPGIFSRNVDISKSTQLRSIHFDDLVLYPEFSHLQQYIPRILSQMTSDSLEEVDFTMWLSAADDLDENVWYFMAQLLGQSRFVNLRRIRFMLHGGCAVGEVEGWMKKRLHSYRERGILQFA